MLISHFMLNLRQLSEPDDVSFNSIERGPSRLSTAIFGVPSSRLGNIGEPLEMSKSHQLDEETRDGEADTPKEPTEKRDEEACCEPGVSSGNRLEGSQEVWNVILSPCTLLLRVSSIGAT